MNHLKCTIVRGVFLLRRGKISGVNSLMGDISGGELSWEMNSPGGCLLEKGEGNAQEEIPHMRRCQTIPVVLSL